MDSSALDDAIYKYNMLTMELACVKTKFQFLRFEEVHKFHRRERLYDHGTSPLDVTVLFQDAP
jgi:hypothetical protein